MGRQVEPRGVEAGVGGGERVDDGAVGKGGAQLSSSGGILSQLKNKKIAGKKSGFGVHKDRKKTLRKGFIPLTPRLSPATWNNKRYSKYPNSSMQF